MSGMTLWSPTMTSHGEWLRNTWLPEPLLSFGDGGRHVDPKEGIARYGPHSMGGASHPSELRVGIIGTAGLIETTNEWLRRNAEGVGGNETNPRFAGFGGDRGFMCRLENSADWNALLSSKDVAETTAVRSQQERFEAAVSLLESRLRSIAELDRPPDCVIIALPAEMYRRCRVAEYYDKELGGRVHRDLRRAFKAVAMRHRIPTQMLRERTVTTGDGTPASKVAWNFFTGLYTKAGGHPWSPTDLQAGSCFVGIGFYRPHGEGKTVQSSVVQAFDEHGEGLILRGQDFEWDPRKEETPSPHLPEAQAHDLLTRALSRYSDVLGQTPRRVVVHKTSRYWPDELAGLRAAASEVTEQVDFLALAGQSRFRMVPPSRYPPLRGTRVQIGRLDYLYTTGFVPALGEFHGMHVPAPIEIADHIGGDTGRTQLLREILTLTKLNWNSAALSGKFPITLRFSRLVGDILRELPAGQEPLPQFKYYM